VRVWKIAGVQCVILYFQHQNKDHLLLLPRGKASNKQAAGSKINKMLFGERAFGNFHLHPETSHSGECGGKNLITRTIRDL
jgi:hypothetical protein